MQPLKTLTGNSRVATVYKHGLDYIVEASPAQVPVMQAAERVTSRTYRSRKAAMTAARRCVDDRL